MTDDQNFIGLVIVIENITKTKQFEQDLIKSKNRAEESDRLKSAFLANMSHEIRTPMNAILGFSDLMASDDYSMEEKSEFVDMIRSSGKLLLNLINDIIDISKIEAGELKIQLTTFKVVDLIDDLYLTFRQNLDQIGKKDVRLIVSRRDEIEDDEITTDKLRLQQIMTNLLSNASKFTTTGQIEFGVIKISSQFQFYVKDSGIGIPESKLEVIFERFRQADDSHTRTYGGTGLGLAITKNLTQLLNGAIWVESVENKGTAFYLTLPAPQNELKKQVQLYDFSGKTILIAEDVEYNYQLIEIFLAESNAKVLHAKNGLIAV
ncbi:MAG: ATP-binding protein, partial [Ignavibacteria bacterium]|nr:ATP-binding protein [Ignavibacteria bacterium]